MQHVACCLDTGVNSEQNGQHPLFMKLGMWKYVTACIRRQSLPKDQSGKEMGGVWVLASLGDEGPPHREGDVKLQARRASTRGRSRGQGRPRGAWPGAGMFHREHRGRAPGGRQWTESSGGGQQHRGADASGLTGCSKDSAGPRSHGGTVEGDPVLQGTLNSTLRHQMPPLLLVLPHP